MFKLQKSGVGGGGETQKLFHIENYPAESSLIMAIDIFKGLNPKKRNRITHVNTTRNKFMKKIELFHII